MLLGRDLDGFFIRAMQTLAPYVPDLVCIGGCANALYRYHPLATSLPWDYVGTMDVDIAVPGVLPPKPPASIAELMRAAGFKELHLGCDNRAVIKYAPDDASPVDLEFLCPMSGLRGTRGHNPIAHAVQAGLHAQPLRYLELLLTRTWDVNPGDVPEFAGVLDLPVRVPNPSAYVVQKILIRDTQRSPAALEKDCFYIYEISGVFRNALDHLRTEYQLLATCPPKWKLRFAVEARRVFRDANAEGPLCATRVFADSGRAIAGTAKLTPEMVARSVNRLLDHMLG
jgi:hypothetical protein